MKMRVIALAFAGLCAAGGVVARDGDFVRTFGTQGRVQIAFAPSLNLALGSVDFTDLVIQPDGKILLSGTAATVNSSDMGVLRLDPNGALDTNFGTQGQTLIAFDGGDANEDVASSILLQPDGRIVLCGQASGNPAVGGTDFGIVRLLPDGSLDAQFSGDGKTTVAFDLGAVGARDDYAVRCSLQGDGKIVAAGRALTNSANTRVAVARLNANGTLDLGFNGSGKTTIGYGSSFPQSLALSVKSFADGRSLLVGMAGGSFSNAWSLARLDATGQLDMSFGNGGTLAFDPGLESYAPYEALDAVVLADNSFVVIGGMALSPTFTNINVGIFKFAPNGSLDTSFGVGGGQVIPFDLGGSFMDLPIKLQRDVQGRFLVAGFSEIHSSTTISMVRLTATGQLDAGFGTGGKLTVATAPPPAADLGDEGSTVALNPDGSIIVGSIANGGGSSTLFGIAKLVGDTIFADGFDEEF